jgi:hypothetical protein
MTDIRYGIFFRPDPETSWAVTQISMAVRQQFGLVAAAAFAPHATLIGNLRIDLSEYALVTLLDSVFANAKSIPIYNHGIQLSGNNVRFDLNRNRAGTGPNQILAEIAGAVRTAVEPLHVRHDDLYAPNVANYRFAAHLTLAGFDLDVDPRMVTEVHDFINGLKITTPPSFMGHWFSLFQFQADWAGHWWHAMEARHIRSWEVQ